MNLVDADRRVERVGAPAALVDRQPGQQALHHRGGMRAQLGAEGEGVGLEADDAVGTEDLVLVELALADAGQEDLPHPALAAVPHHVAAPVPGVEAADHRDPARVGCPHREARAGHPVYRHRVRTQPLVGAVMAAFGKQPDVEILDERAEAVGVVEVRLAAVVPVHVQVVAQRQCACRERGDEEGGAVLGLQLEQHLAVVIERHDLAGAGQQRAQHHAARDRMRAEQREGVGMTRLQQGLQGLWGHPGEVRVHRLQGIRYNALSRCGLAGLLFAAHLRLSGSSAGRFFVASQRSTPDSPKDKTFACFALQRIAPKAVRPERSSPRRGYRRAHTNRHAPTAFVGAAAAANRAVRRATRSRAIDAAFAPAGAPTQTTTRPRPL